MRISVLNCVAIVVIVSANVAHAAVTNPTTPTTLNANTYFIRAHIAF